MSTRATYLTVVCISLAGCVTPPAEDSAPRPRPAPIAAPPSLAATEVLEQRHRERAQNFVRERNWADAQVEWDLLLLLKPDSQEYRDALAEARKRIREAADSLLRAAEQAQRQGNLDQAQLMYLRVLAVDRDNATAAQALRDIDAERTRRAYINRPPRLVM